MLPQRGDQYVDGCNRPEILQCHLAFGNFQIELGFHRKHEIDQIEGVETNLAQVLVDLDRAADRAALENFMHDVDHAVVGDKLGGGRMSIFL